MENIQPSSFESYFVSLIHTVLSVAYKYFQIHWFMNYCFGFIQAQYNSTKDSYDMSHLV